MNWLLKRWKWVLGVCVLAGVLVRGVLNAFPVVVHEVQRSFMIAEVTGTGTLDARIKTTISPKLQEVLAEVFVDVGDQVKQGQNLARLDDRELTRQVEVSEAILAAARATEERVRVDEARAAAVETQARSEHKRATDLHNARVSSQSELDKAIEQLQVAESDLARSRAATLEAQRHVSTAEKNLAYQRERLGFTWITSPYDGVITRRDHDPGGVVVPGTSLLHLVSTSEMWVSAWVDETASAALAVGQKARVVFRSDSDQVYPGTVARIGRETDRETREFATDILVEKLPPNWMVGQRADAIIETGRVEDALVIPLKFLAWRGGKAGVFAMASGKAQWREVQVGLQGVNQVEIRAGVKAGERVVAPAQPSLKQLQNGQRIRVR